ncbi:MAG: hypothetical protein QM703_01245 [Gemmatales bacterium]
MTSRLKGDRKHSDSTAKNQWLYSGMSITSPEPTQLTLDHRRRRWLIRFSLAALVVVFLLTIAGFLALSSSRITPEGFDAAFEKLRRKPVLTRDEVEALLGKPQLEEVDDDQPALTWNFVNQSLNHIESYGCTLAHSSDGTIHIVEVHHSHIDGWSAWANRWIILKHKLGW